MKNRCRKTTPFTLIELLVVIGIIAILASMVMPAMGRTRDSAKTATCISNHKQIASFLISYMSDFSGYCPPAAYQSGGDTWIVALFENDYMPEPKEGKPTPAVCPNGLTANNQSTKTYTGVWGGSWGWRTIGIVHYGAAPADVSKNGFSQLLGEYPVWRVPAVRKPSSTFLHGDSLSADLKHMGVIVRPWGNYARDYMGAYHNNKQNTVIGFVDGHVESLNNSTLKNKYKADESRLKPRKK